METFLNICMGIIISIIFIVAYGEFGGFDNHPIEEATEYEVSCVDDILTGRFLFIDGEYFRYGATKATWIPLNQCGLEPVEVN